MSATTITDNQGADRILAAAQRLFAEKGFAATSMQDIASTAGVSKANVFHHYSSKDALYRAVLGCACDEWQSCALPAMDGAGDFPARLHGLLAGDIDFMLTQPERARLVLNEVMNTERDLPGQPAPDLLHENAKLLIAALQHAKQAGEIRDDLDPVAAVFMFLAASKFYFLTRNLLHHFPEVDFADDPGRFVDKMTDLMLKGVLPR